MKIHPFHALLPDKSIIASPSSFATDVKMHFRNYIDTGYINTYKRETYFAYQIKSKDKTFRGVLATLDIDDIIKGKVLPHENTLHHKEQTSMQLILDRGAIIKPLFLTHKPVKQIHKLINEIADNARPLQSFFYSTIKERHSIWPIKDKEVEKQIRSAFKSEIKKVYIADGHHRVAVLQRLYGNKKHKKSMKYGTVISAFFDFDNLEILDYNRLVDYADNMSALELMALLSQSATITPLTDAQKPGKKFEITLYMDNTWFKLEWKKKIIASYKSKVVLDATILNDILLKKTLGIKNVESDQHIKYLPGNLSFHEIETKVDRQVGSVAFCLYPVRITELQKQADLGKTLPPKSTFFKPRLPNGFVSQYLGKQK